MTKEQAIEATEILSSIHWLDSFIRLLEDPLSTVVVCSDTHSVTAKEHMFRTELLELAKDRREKLNEKLEKL